MARARQETCPVCGRSLPDFGDWPAWCAECGWGLDPAELQPAVPASGLAAWWQRRTANTEAAELQRLVADPALLARRHPSAVGIYAAAAGIHLVTLALLAAGVFVMTTSVVTVLKVFAGIVAFGLVAVTFPLHRLRPARAARSDAAPTSLAVAATVAKAVGVAAPKRLRVTSSGRAEPATSGRVLTLDADRWRVLGAPGRIALLAHELAHHNGHDPRRTMLASIASETLDGWLTLLRPDPRAAGRRKHRRRSLRSLALATPAPPPTPRETEARNAAQSQRLGMTEWMLLVAISPIFGLVLGFGWQLRERGQLAGLRAELYADALAAGTGGSHGVEYVTELIDGELAELAAAGRTPVPLAELPAAERERRRRIAVATGSRVDEVHPTFAARLQMLAALATPQSSVGVSGADLEAMTRELVALAPPEE